MPEIGALVRSSAFGALVFQNQREEEPNERQEQEQSAALSQAANQLRRCCANDGNTQYTLPCTNLSSEHHWMRPLHFPLFLIRASASTSAATSHAH